MRTVHHPKSARSWLTSSFFITWIAVSTASFVATYGAGWIGGPDPATQMARMFVTGGTMELM